MLDPRRLRLLLLLESLGTVRAVAEAAAMSPSAVSQQLAVLERESGAALLSRHGRTVSLTNAGVTLAAHARAILERISAAEEDLRALREDPGGTVGVAAPTTALRAFVIAAASALGRDGVSMQLAELEPAACLRALTRGEVDLAIVADFGDGTLPRTPHLRSVALARDELFAVLGPDAPAGRVELAALAGEPWLLDGTELERHLLRRCRRAGFEPRVAARLISHEALLFAVRSGLGVTVLPSFALHIAEGVSIRPLEPAAHRQLLVLHREEALDRRSVALALDALVAAARDADLAAATLGPLQRLDGPVELSEPDPRWPEWFAREAERIRGALGERVLVLEHVGSTSVPGLVAKPRIDIVLAVADPADEDAYVPALDAAGYTLRIREPSWHEHRMFHGPGVAVNLHVFAPGASELDRLLRFRDRLRERPDERDRYAAAKRELARRRWRHVQDYADAKTEIVEAILSAA